MTLTSRQPWYIVLGLLLVLAVFLLVRPHLPADFYGLVQSYRTFVTLFLGIFIEALPFLLLGTLASGFVEEFISQESLARLIPHHRVGGTLVGALLGLAFPVCECGVVPLTRRLLRKGLPLPIGVTFLLAAPVVNPMVIASTYAAFGWGPILLGRIGFTLLIAIAVGLLFGLAPQPLSLLQRAAWPTASSNEAIISSSTVHTSSKATRLSRALALAGDEFFEMGRYLVMGSLLAAGMQTIIPQAALLKIGSGALWSVVAMLSLAFVLSVCSTVDAFLALAFVNTFTTGSLLGFLVFGPMVDIKSTLMFLGVFRRRIVLYLILLPLTLSLFVAVYVNLNVRW
jgi:uncharacterized membrane protein YraQ (UPF0718 family)